MPNQTLTALSTQLKSGAISATELASDYLARIAASDPAVWRDILSANRTEVLAQLAHFRASLAQFEAAMQESEVRGCLERYWGNHHGFAFNDRPTYDEKADKRHWMRLLDLFQRNLH